MAHDAPMVIAGSRTLRVNSPRTGYSCTVVSSVQASLEHVAFAAVRCERTYPGLACDRCSCAAAGTEPHQGAPSSTLPHRKSASQKWDSCCLAQATVDVVTYVFVQIDTSQLQLQLQLLKRNPVGSGAGRTVHDLTWCVFPRMSAPGQHQSRLRCKCIVVYRVAQRIQQHCQSTSSLVCSKRKRPSIPSASTIGVSIQSASTRRACTIRRAAVESGLLSSAG